MRVFLLSMSLVFSTFCMYGQEPVVSPREKTEQEVRAEENFRRNAVGYAAMFVVSTGLGVVNGGINYCMIDEKPFQGPTNDPNAVAESESSIKGRTTAKVATDAAFLVFNYAACVGIKSMCAQDQELKAPDKKKTDEFPVLSGGEIAISILGNSLGRSMVTGVPTIGICSSLFNLDYSDAEVALPGVR